MLALSFLSFFTLVPIVRGLAFNDITFIFSFGDSYTADGYQPALGYSPVTGQTSTTTSGGLKELEPRRPGITCWNDHRALGADLERTTFADWLQFLAHIDPDTANSFYDFATQGASVTNAIVNTGVSSFVDQVTTFEKYFVEPVNSPPWKSQTATTLFSVWFGINDIGYSYLHGQIFPEIIDSVLATYDDQIQRLYADGARNFLINNVPPTDRTPLVVTYGAATVALFETNVALWNLRIAAYVAAFSTKYPGATATLFDANTLFNTILATPSTYKIADTTSVCSAYSTVTDQPFLYLPSCQWPLQAYFWHNTYHPTWPVHQAVADGIVLTLSTSSTSTKRMRKRSGHRLDDQH
ncbi:hypothetical protein BCR35DRAFT_176136 [Leucosporidium creatinivorum]|uniref:GDSL lipase/esterase n=1 Tax=Leucosporidium creatinivorum TaxID=106004 RepID=A0A1Y2G105_9BASI|nr:hypothetical protein BCR35DRAFT_176136 [Leucosporidium creatinivorum]